MLPFRAATLGTLAHFLGRQAAKRCTAAARSELGRATAFHDQLRIEEQRASSRPRIQLEQHRLIAEGDLVVQYVTLHGTHRASTMPLLANVPVSGRPAAWTFIHIWRVVDGMLVEHWACRDDLGLVEQLRPS